MLSTAFYIYIAYITNYSCKTYVSVLCLRPVNGRFRKHQLFERVSKLLRHATVDAKVERVRQADAQIDEDNDGLDN